MKNLFFKDLLEKAIRKEASAEEIQVLLNLLSNDAISNESLDAVWHDSMGEMDRDKQTKILGKIYNRISEKEGHVLSLKKTKRQVFYRSILKYAAIVLLALLTGIGSYYYALNTMPEQSLTITANKGQKTSMTLSDGTVVWLNSGSTLSYGKRFNKKERILQLDGEAFFSVAHDKSRPFVVQANGMEVEVFGTEFNVNTRQEKMSVSLLKGSVAIAYKGNTEKLVPGEVAYCDSQSPRIAIEKEDVFLNKLWTLEQLQFKDQPLKEVVRNLSGWYGVDITLAKSLENFGAFTFTLKNEPLEEVLKMLSMTNPIAYKMEDENHVKIYSLK